MTKAEALATLLIMLPAIWAGVHLSLSRAAELKANSLEKRGASDADVAMLRNKARTFQDVSRLMPTGMLVVLMLGLIWRGIQLSAPLFS